jgi:ankyrin repeat protein
VLAARLGLAEFVEAVVDADPEAINGPDSRQNTPLHAACNSGHYELVCLLFDLGASPSIINAKSLTPNALAITGSNDDHNFAITRMLSHSVAPSEATQLLDRLLTRRFAVMSW